MQKYDKNLFDSLLKIDWTNVSSRQQEEFDKVVALYKQANLNNAMAHIAYIMCARFLIVSMVLSLGLTYFNVQTNTIIIAIVGVQFIMMLNSLVIKFELDEIEKVVNERLNILIKQYQAQENKIDT